MGQAYVIGRTKFFRNKYRRNGEEGGDTSTEGYTTDDIRHTTEGDQSGLLQIGLNKVYLTENQIMFIAYLHHNEKWLYGKGWIKKNEFHLDGHRPKRLIENENKKMCIAFV